MTIQTLREVIETMPILEKDALILDLFNTLYMELGQGEEDETLDDYTPTLDKDLDSDAIGAVCNMVWETVTPHIPGFSLTPNP